MLCVKVMCYVIIAGVSDVRALVRRNKGIKRKVKIKKRKKKK